MKEYIVLTIDTSTNSIIFNYKTIDEQEESFINKNSLFKDSLFCTPKYYKKNEDKIVNFINEKYPSLNVLKIQRIITFKNIVNLIDKLNIINLKLNFLSTIDLEDYELFLNCKTIKIIDCYFMASNIIEKFKEKGIKVNTYSEHKISKKFMESQNVTLEDALYYKKVISIKEEYNDLIEDLKEFLKLNYKLKAIHLYVYSKDLISSIVNLVKNDESRNVVIFLHQGSDKGDFIVNNFEWLKELSDKCKEDYTCEFRILYSSSFLKNNLFKQLTFNNLKLISILCVYVCVVCLVIVKCYDYIEKISIDELNNELINESYASEEENIEEENTQVDEIEEQDNQLEVNAEELDKEVIKSKYTFDKSFSKLKKINNETVGYLVVNDTEISYPVVQHSDNSYYLKRDFYKKKNSMGWIYLDYRNNIKDLNDNSIIYGHSMLNGTMFGTLKKVLSSTWRKTEENMIITLDTVDGTYKFKIFSAYKVDYTTDYLKTNFDSSSDKKDFIKLIRGRSSFKTSDTVGVDDKILTLSTCTGSNNKRLVVHAVLLKEE